MATLEISFLSNQLEARKRRLEDAIALAPQNTGLAGLLREVDAALERMAKGSYGLCEECHDTVEQDRLLADPLVRYCLDHLTQLQRDALQRDLDLAAEVQRKLLPQAGLRTGGWETSYHYAPLGPVSGDYCDLIPSDGQLFFVVGDVSGKGVAASMLMTQLHALFRSLAGTGLPLGQIVAQVNRVFCESALAGQYATLVCGHAKPGGNVELFNAGHLPVIAVQEGCVRLLESTAVPLGMFREASFTSASLKLGAGDMFFLYTDGLSEAHGENGEYGIERVTNLVGRQASCSAARLISECLKDLRGFAGAGPGVDDVTLLAVRHAA